MHTPKYCLFFDNHTMKSCPDAGAGFEVEKFTDLVRECGVDYMTFHARCNQGFAYYDTQIGIKHPSLEYDLFGQLAESCQRKDIALTAYLNAGISQEEGRLHRDWTTLYFDGREYREIRLNPYVRTMCYNSPYRDHLIAMIKEIAGKYPVSGFFLDCMAPYPCICPICVAKMKELGINWENQREVENFSSFSILNLCKDIAQAVKEIMPEPLLYFNGPGYEDQINSATYLECECLPTCPGWGYDHLPVLSHHMRTLGDMPVLNMTGRFYDWGDFGGLRTQAGIEYDLFYGLANEMRPNIGDHFHPRGDINYPAFDMVKKIYHNLRQYEEWFEGAKTFAEVAVIFPKSGPEIRRDKGLRGITRMLSELKIQFDIVTEASDWSKYKVLLLPDSVSLSSESAKRIKAHIKAGKGVISSGWSGLDMDKKHFVLEDEWGIKFIKDCDCDPAYFEGDMPLALYARGTEVAALQKTRIRKKIIKPYYNAHWDGEHAFYYCPPDQVCDLPLLTVKEKVAHFSFPIFSGYHEKAAKHLRDIFSEVLDEFLTDKILVIENAPSFLKAFVTIQPNRKIVHLLAYLPEIRGQIQIVEEELLCKDVKISLQDNETEISRAYLAPDKTPCQFERKDNYIELNLPEVKGHMMVVFEFN